MDWFFRRRMSQGVAANGQPELSEPSEPLDPNARDKFHKFTQRARAALNYSQQEAQRRGDSLIGPEHLLLGLIHDEGCVASVILKSLGFPLDHIRESLVSRMEPAAESPVQTGAITPGAKKTIELSVDEARRFGHSYVGTEHLLLGIIAEEESVAADTLRKLGVERGLVRRAVREGARAQDPAPANPTGEDGASAEGY